LTKVLEIGTIEAMKHSKDVELIIKENELLKKEVELLKMQLKSQESVIEEDDNLLDSGKIKDIALGTIKIDSLSQDKMLAVIKPVLEVDVSDKCKDRFLYSLSYELSEANYKKALSLVDAVKNTYRDDLMIHRSFNKTLSIPLYILAGLTAIITLATMGIFTVEYLSENTYMMDRTLKSLVGTGSVSISSLLLGKFLQFRYIRKELPKGSSVKLGKLFSNKFKIDRKKVLEYKG